MRTSYLLAVFAVACIGLSPSRASDPVLMRTLQQRISDFAHAVNTNNAAGIKAHIPDSAKFQLSDHHMLTAREFLQTIAQTEKTVKDLKMVANLKSATMTSNGAWGNLSIVTTGRHRDSKGRWHRVETRERAMVSWRKTADGYVLERITQISFVQKVDGRVVAEVDRA